MKTYAEMGLFPNAKSSESGGAGGSGALVRDGEEGSRAEEQIQDSLELVRTLLGLDKAVQAATDFAQRDKKITTSATIKDSERSESSPDDLADMLSREVAALIARLKEPVRRAIQSDAKAGALS